MELLLKGILIGVGATVFMDLWNILMWKVLHQPLPNWALVGRWFWNLKNAKVFHDDIGRAEPYRNELALGWIAHYAVGIICGVLLAFAGGPEWFAAPTFLPALIVGIVTIVPGWFLLHPGLGMGFAGSKLPNPNQFRISNLVLHTVFALGYYVTALVIR